MIDTRIKKAVGDLWLDRGRTLIVILAIAIGIFSIGAVITGYSILDREMNANYMNTNPASAILYVNSADVSLLNMVEDNSEVQDAELRRPVTARIQTGPDEWQNAQLFVIEDFNNVRVSTISSETGSWPAVTGEILFERVALPLTGKAVGDPVVVKTANGQAINLKVAGTVHDPGLAPANMEGIAYGYITAETLESLGESPYYNQLMFVVATDSSDEAYIKSVAYRLKSQIEQQGYTVSRIEVPHPGKHPHASQMSSLMFLFEAFGILAFILSMLLVFNMITGLLARQVREIGVMKAVGATTVQIMATYLTGILVMGILATALALPVSILAGQALAAMVAGMLNFDIFSNAIPWWVFAAIIGTGLLVPVLSAAYPVYRGSRVTVHESINDYGISDTGKPGIISSLIGRAAFISRPLRLSLRNMFRRRERLALTLLTLGIGGALFIVAMNLNTSMDATVDNALDTRHFDEIVLLSDYYPAESIYANLTGVPGVSKTECMASTGASVTYADGTDSNQFSVFATMPESAMISYPILEGRWLQPGDTNAIVLNHMLAKELGEQGDGRSIKAGDNITLNLNGQKSSWRVVGIAREMMAPPRAYISYDYFTSVTGMENKANAAVISTVKKESLAAGTSGHSLSIHGISLSHGQPAAGNSDSIMPLIESQMQNKGMNIATVASISDMRVRLKEHLGVIVAFVMCMSAMAVTVGILGLASSMSINVLERRREFGVMRAIGATAYSINYIIMAEALVTGLLSWLLAIVLAPVISITIGNFFGMIFFNSPLDIAISHPAMAVWLLIVAVLSPAACIVSAMKASRQPVHEVLAYE